MTTNIPTEQKLTEDFDRWFARNHPWDWFAKERGESMATKDRLLVWAMCRKAYLRQERPQHGF